MENISSYLLKKNLNDKYFEEIFTNFEKLMWKKKEGLYKFLTKFLSKSRENFRKMLTKFKKTLRYSLIWKEKNVVAFDLKKRAIVPLWKAQLNGVKRDI